MHLDIGSRQGVTVGMRFNAYLSHETEAHPIVATVTMVADDHCIASINSSAAQTPVAGMHVTELADRP